MLKIAGRIKKNFAAIMLAFSFSLVALPAVAGAEDVFKKVCPSQQQINSASGPAEKKRLQEISDSAVCKEKAQSGNPLFGPEGILTVIINILSILVGIAATIMIMVGGLKFITSGSSPQDVTVARETVLYAVVGLVVAASAQLLVHFVLVRIV